MKTLILSLFLFLSLSITAQVSEQKFDISLGSQNAYMIDHIDAEKKMVEKVLEETFKQYGKVKRNRKAKEWSCQECKISTISTTPINVYYRIEEGKGQVTSYTFFDDGTKFVSGQNDSDASRAIEKINMDIYYGVRKAVITKELEVAEKGLKNFEKDLGKLEKKNTNLHGDIDNYKEKILQAEKDIEKNLQEQEDKRIEIEQQKKMISKITEKLNNVGRN